MTNQNNQGRQISRATSPAKAASKINPASRPRTPVKVASRVRTNRNNPRSYNASIALPPGQATGAGFLWNWIDGTDWAISNYRNWVE